MVTHECETQLQVSENVLNLYKLKKPHNVVNLANVMLVSYSHVLVLRSNKNVKNDYKHDYWYFKGALNTVAIEITLLSRSSEGQPRADSDVNSLSTRLYSTR